LAPLRTRDLPHANRISRLDSAAADLPAGNFAVDVKLFAGGGLAARTKSALQAIESGLEQSVAEAASDYGLLYGLGTALFATGIGWLASVVFRRD